jgi:hypothetical protein
MMSSSPTIMPARAPAAHGRRPQQRDVDATAPVGRVSIGSARWWDTCRHVQAHGLEVPRAARPRPARGQEVLGLGEDGPVPSRARRARARNAGDVTTAWANVAITGLIPVKSRLAATTPSAMRSATYWETLGRSSDATTLELKASSSSTVRARYATIIEVPRTRTPSRAAARRYGAGDEVRGQGVQRGVTLDCVKAIIGARSPGPDEGLAVPE